MGDAATFVIASGAVALALVAAWARVPDLRAPIGRRPPLLETVRAMREGGLLAVGALNFVLSFAAGGMVLTTLALLVRARHVSLFGLSEKGTSGIFMGIMTMLDAAMTPVAGRLGDKWRAHARVATVSLVVMIPGLVLVGISGGALGIAVGIALVGIGAAGLGPSLLVIMGELVPRERRGTGAGLLQLCGDVGGTLGPLVGTALFAGSTVLPYVGTAGLIGCAVPVGVWLARREGKGAGG